MSIARKNWFTFLRLANILGFLAAAGGPVQAQIEITSKDPLFSKIDATFVRTLAEHHEHPLACHVEAIRPRLAYSFRFFAGFYSTVAARELSPGKGNRLVALFRITSEASGEKHYFIYPYNVPPIPEDPGKTQLEGGGGFYVGDGDYKVDWLLVDQKERSCIRSWMVRTPKSKIPLLIPAGAIQPLGLEAWKGFGEKKSDARMTVFLSAMPIYRRRTLSKLQPFDLAVLLSSLTTMLDSSKYGHARVVVFDLLGKRILFEQDDFDPAGYKRLRDKLETTSYGTIDYQTLARGVTGTKLFEEMLKAETAKPVKSDAIVFLGAEGPPSDKLPPVFAEYRQSFARLFYVYFARFPQPVQDVMYQLVHAGKGKVVPLFGPPDLVNAIRAIDSAN